ncbi:TetR/AcrR family transcriptional regulator [Pseudactinotalea sp. HY158]|uniref:TetR/AcrR family transcriptional regulator n=1 Tax=Pseudactinotalea sp. HY158 TaxID=2654547 RepID=UPI00129C2232|nr:TetR/AcrR family transcriptional regulator [Pseudactinotalea sp. HY158]QGH68796.1 TetR family transcriptional regulator [Pseudactinotalea sp. HY158]
MSESITTAPPEGLRERKKQDTRRSLRHAAMELALERGLENVTVDEIAEAADVSPRTFFNYFASKEDALIDHTDAVAAELHAAILARPEGEPPLESLRHALAQSEVLRGAHVHRDRTLARQRLIHAHPSLLARQLGQAAALEAAIAAALAERMHLDPTSDPTPQLLGALAGSVLRVSLRRWITGDARLDDLVEESFTILRTRLGGTIP